MATRSKSGGGITSKNNREVGQRFGNAGGNAKGPGGVNQLGAHWGRHVTDRRESSSYRGDPLDLGIGYSKGPAFGNTLTTNVGVGGPGKGRDPVMKAGSQGCWGSVNPGSSPARKDQLSDFGPDYQRKGRFGK
jgi:hypothetical protein